MRPRFNPWSGKTKQKQTLDLEEMIHGYSRQEKRQLRHRVQGQPGLLQTAGWKLKRMKGEEGKREKGEKGEESRERGESSAIKDQHKDPYKKETWAGEK